MIGFVQYLSQMSELSVELRHAKRSNKKQLLLNKRELSFIPKQIYTIRTLEELHLADNKINNIEPEIAELFRLKVLNLQNNCLAQLPNQIMHLPKLSVICLKGNPLSSKFEPLLSISYKQNLTDTLTHCFENQSPLKNTGKSTKNQTPSWLIQEKSSKESTEISWDTNIFKGQKPSTANKTFYGRRPGNKNENGVEVQGERECVNGVLVLKMSDLDIGEQISMGGFSTIHRGRYMQLQVAIKKVFNPNISEELLNEFNNEVSMLAKYRHPNIVLMIAAITTPPQLCLIMQLVKQGTLYDLIHKRKANLSDQEKRRITLQIISVINYLHRHGIVHRDIKSHNFLVDKNYNVKICDFGLARHKSQLNSGPMQFSGTPTYMAQQLFLKRAYSESVDIFAIGTLLYELYAGEVPYHGLQPVDIKQKILKDSNLPGKLSIRKPVLQLINRCRRVQAQERPSSGQLLKFSEW